MTIVDTILDQNLYADTFAGPSWFGWRVILKALFALPMVDAEIEFFRHVTGWTNAPTEMLREGWIIAGRRAGKTIMMAFVAIYLTVFVDHSKALAPGELGVGMLLAADRSQSKVLMRYIEGLIDRVPMIAALVVRRTRESIQFSNGIVVEIHTSNYRAVRGRTLIFAICDEACFWPTDDSANPAAEVIAALRPALVTVPGSLVLVISTPHSRSGAVFEMWRRYFGREGPILVVQAPTRTLNPTIPEHVVERALEEDPEAARAEWLAAFRDDISSFVSREAVEAAIVPERFELPPIEGAIYAVGMDLAGGTPGGDSATVAIAHPEERDGQTFAVLDVVLERRPPFSPESVVAEFAEVLKRYGAERIISDRWAGEWAKEPFRKLGLEFELAPKPKSDVYKELLPLLNSGRVELLDDRRLCAQLIGLERRTARGGRDTVDHAVNSRDDVVNSAALALVAVHNQEQEEPVISW